MILIKFCCLLILLMGDNSSEEMNKHDCFVKRLGEFISFVQFTAVLFKLNTGMTLSRKMNTSPRVSSLQT